MRRTLLSIVKGACAALVVQLLVVAVRSATRSEPPRALDEQAGRIREVLVHFSPSAEFVRETYAQFFRALPKGVRVRVACEKREDLEEFLRWTGREATPVVIGKPITTWARDRFVACADGSLAVPYEPQPGGPERRNDALVPFALGPATRRAPFRFDGGDFLATHGRIIASSVWAARNPERASEDLVRLAEEFFHEPVVFLPHAPNHHIGMAVAPIGKGRLLVGDARWGARLRPAGVDADVSEDTARAFDAVAEDLARAGFLVDRIPVVPTTTPYVWITYTNGLFEDRTVYLPTYGLADLDAAATEVYRRLGFVIHPIGVSRVYVHGGTLHCLVHVLRRD